MFLTPSRLRAAGLQRSLNSQSEIRRSSELTPWHKRRGLCPKPNAQLTTTNSPWESALASLDLSLITGLFGIRKPQSVAPAPTSSRPCRLRMFSRSKTRPPWQNEWHTLRLNNWRSRPVRLWMRILNRSSNILTKKGTTPSHLPVLRRKFERASRPRIASRARPRAFLLLKYPHFRSLYLHYCFYSR